MKETLSTFTIGKVDESISVQAIQSLVDDYAYMLSNEYAYGLDKYIFIYVKNCPKLVPKWLWYWIVSKVVNISEFHTPRKTFGMPIIIKDN